MMRVLALVLALALVGAAAADKRFEGDGVYCDVKGQSGKIEIGALTATGKTKIVINFDSMTELDAGGNAIATSGSNKHSFRNFAQKDFTFSRMRSTEYQGLKVKSFNFTATDVVGNGDLVVAAYLFNESGTIVNGANGAEETDVIPGQVKFDISVNDWPFCEASGSGATSCTKAGVEQVGAFVELDLVIMSKNKPSKRAKSQAKEACKLAKGSGVQCVKPKKFSLGGDSAIDLSTAVQYDGTWDTMPEGYPAFEQKGGKSVFTFRFAKSNAISYDPSIQLFAPATDDDNAAVSTSASMVCALVVLVATLLAALMG